MSYKRFVHPTSGEVTLRRVDVPRGDYIAFNEPVDADARPIVNQVVVMSAQAVADYMQRKALDCGFCYVSREQAIIEFMVVHWAWYSDRYGRTL